ncbi:MAG: glycosyltransferase family 8 protein [Planctomycetota bacterium]|nr:glycosyltransferase family 8 protein [Planctomycetota bacterium]
MITNLQPSQLEISLDSVRSTDPLLVCATDDAYVMPLAAMLYSAGQNLRVGSELHVLILDGGVSEENRHRLKESLADHPIHLEWVTFNAEILQNFQVSHHVSHTAYYRLLLSEVLPASIHKILYLDCDLLIRGDLVELWEMDLEGATIGAVPDIACPNIDASHGMDNFRLANPYLASFCPVGNYEELGIDSKARYFNSGVMLIDLQQWRQRNISQRLIDCMRENEEHIWCWDQYALNVVLHDQWKEIGLQWNLGSHAFEYPDARYSPVSGEDFDLMLEDPQVVHFTTEWKPWHYGIDHAYRDEFFQSLDQTAWNAWRPVRPAFSLQKWIDWVCVGVIKRGTIFYRKAVSIW